MQHCSVLFKFTPWTYHLVWPLVLQVSLVVVLVCFVSFNRYQHKSMRHAFLRSLVLNPRPEARGGETPSGFSRIGKNDYAQRRCSLHTLSAIIYAPFLKNLTPGHLRSGHQVRSRTLPPKSLWCYSGYSFWAINMKLSGYHKTISSYKTLIFDFWFRWPKVRSILWPTH